MVADAAPEFGVRLFHVYLKDGYGPGKHVKAGERIGSLGAHQGTDVSVQIGTMPWNEEFVSVFQVMSENVFAEYQKRGVHTRDDVIISKEYRDAHPIQCEGKPEEKFIYPTGYDHDADDVYLSGYVKAKDQNKGPANQNPRQQQ
jgi:hypothetical protein